VLEEGERRVTRGKKAHYCLELSDNDYQILSGH
jgi:hypothetical protein